MNDFASLADRIEHIPNTGFERKVTFTLDEAEKVIEALHLAAETHNALVEPASRVVAQEESKAKIVAIVLSAILGKADGEIYGASHARKLNEDKAERAAERILALCAVTEGQRATPCNGADDLEHLDGMLDDRERGQ